jgi:olefin beta-lactone synthetase
MDDRNIAYALGRVAATQGEQTALVAREGKIWRQWTFAELRQNSDGFASALHARGVRQGIGSC